MAEKRVFETFYAIEGIDAVQVEVRDETEWSKPKRVGYLPLPDIATLKKFRGEAWRFDIYARLHWNEIDWVE